MSILRRLKCAVLGHEYRVHQHFTPHSRRVVCACGGDWAMNDDARALVNWNGEFEDMYRPLGHRIMPRAPS